MALDFIPIQSGEKGAEVANNILTNFNAIATEISNLRIELNTLRSSIAGLSATTITETSPVSVNLNPSILYVKSTTIDTVFRVNVQVMRGDEELVFGSDDYQHKFGVTVNTPTILKNGVTVCTVETINDGGSLVLKVTSKAATNTDSNIEFTVTFKGVEYPQTLPLVISHKEAKDGRGVFVSTIFIRDTSESGPTTPFGGSYASPLPDGVGHQGWSDGIPAGVGPLWCSHRKFTSDGEEQDEYWSTPVKAFDNGDIDVAYSAMEDTPTRSPGNVHPTQGTGTAPEYWHDEGTSEDIWMAVSTKSAGVWSDWVITRVRGEKGDDGQSVVVSHVFARSKTGMLDSDKPTSDCGSYRTPNPTSQDRFFSASGKEWFDGVPDGNGAIYMSSRIFTDDTKAPQQTEWTKPALLADSDEMDICYHRETANGNQPDPPSDKTHPNQGNDTTTWHDSGCTEDAWMAMSTKTDGVWSKWNVMRIRGEKGQACCTTYVFTRSENTVTDPPSNDKGLYYDLSPETYWEGANHTKWYDAIPSGNYAVWMTYRVVTNDGLEPQTNWAVPVKMADSDIMDVCYHRRKEDGTEPEPPSKTLHPVQDDPSGWHDSGCTEDYWMAVAFKSGGSWGGWNISKIKGEDGDPGADGLVIYFEPNIISATEPYSGGGMDVTHTYSKLCVYDDGLAVSANKFEANILSASSVNLGEIHYSFGERDMSSLQPAVNNNCAYYFWIDNFAAKGNPSYNGTAEIEIKYDGTTYYRSVSWMCNWLGTFKTTISGDVYTAVSTKVSQDINDAGYIDSVSAQTIFQQCASGLTSQVKELSGSVNGLTEQYSTIKQTCDEISLKVGSNNGIRPNLLPNSLLNLTTRFYWFNPLKIIYLNAGTYTLSIKANLNSTAATAEARMNCHAYLYDNDWSHVCVVTGGTKTVYSNTFTVPSNGTKCSIGVYLCKKNQQYVAGVGHVGYVDWIKLESGSGATEWCMSSNDSACVNLLKYSPYIAFENGAKTRGTVTQIKDNGFNYIRISAEENGNWQFEWPNSGISLDTIVGYGKPCIYYYWVVARRAVDRKDKKSCLSFGSNNYDYAYSGTCDANTTSIVSIYEDSAKTSAPCIPLNDGWALYYASVLQKTKPIICPNMLQDTYLQDKSKWSGEATFSSNTAIFNKQSNVTLYNQILGQTVTGLSSDAWYTFSFAAKDELNTSANNINVVITGDTLADTDTTMYKCENWVVSEITTNNESKVEANVSVTSSERRYAVMFKTHTSHPSSNSVTIQIRAGNTSSYNLTLRNVKLEKSAGPTPTTGIQSISGITSPLVGINSVYGVWDVLDAGMSVNSLPSIESINSKLKADIVTSQLYDTGIDIENKNITVTANRFLVKDNDGNTQALFENGGIATNWVSASTISAINANIDTLEVSKLTTYNGNAKIKISDGLINVRDANDVSRVSISPAELTSYTNITDSLVALIPYDNIVTGTTPTESLSSTSSRVPGNLTKGNNTNTSYNTSTYSYTWLSTIPIGDLTSYSGQSLKLKNPTITIEAIQLNSSNVSASRFNFGYVRGNGYQWHMLFALETYENSVWNPISTFELPETENGVKLLTLNFETPDGYDVWEDEMYRKASVKSSNIYIAHIPNIQDENYEGDITKLNNCRISIYLSTNFYNNSCNINESTATTWTSNMSLKYKLTGHMDLVTEPVPSMDVCSNGMVYKSSSSNYFYAGQDQTVINYGNYGLYVDNGIVAVKTQAGSSGNSGIDTRFENVRNVTIGGYHSPYYITNGRNYSLCLNIPEFIKYDTFILGMLNETSDVLLRLPYQGLPDGYIITVRSLKNYGTATVETFADYKSILLNGSTSLISSVTIPSMGCKRFMWGYIYGLACWGWIEI